ncbi:MAG: hypothetical protein WDZ76_07270 [Pseudohongiellaceae bacterium]
MDFKLPVIPSALALALSTTVSAQGVSVGEAISEWPQGQQDTVQMMIEKYGEPSGATNDRVVWTESDGPWDETIVYREAIEHEFPMPHEDYLEQSVFLEVPADKMDELSEFDGSIIVYRTEGRIAARCDKEAANFLALNLAHDIINDDKSVERAREEYADAIREMLSGTTPEIMSQLTFEPMDQDRAAAADVSVIDPDEQPSGVAGN